MVGVIGVSGELNRLIEGTYSNYIKCIDVDYKSERDEKFKFIRL